MFYEEIDGIYIFIWIQGLKARTSKYGKIERLKRIRSNKTNV
jgi:hypothetical protein